MKVYKLEQTPYLFSDFVNPFQVLMSTQRVSELKKHEYVQNLLKVRMIMDATKKGTKLRTIE